MTSNFAFRKGGQYAMLERNLSIGTIIFSAFFLIMILQMDNKFNDGIGSAGWPLILMGLMMFFGIILTINLFLRGKNNVDNTDEKKDEKDDEEILYPNRLYYSIIILALYTVSLYFIGFIISTFIFTVVLTILFGLKNWIKSFATALTCVTLFIILFPILLNIPFPRGIGIFRELSVLFY